MPSRKLEDLEPVTQGLVRTLVDRMAAIGHPVKPICTYRSAAEQDALYAKGRTEPGVKVTYKKGGESAHNFRMACDMLFVNEGWGGPWKLLGEEAEKLGLVWGGRWTLHDYDHVERKDWKHVKVAP